MPMHNRAIARKQNEINFDKSSDSIDKQHQAWMAQIRFHGRNCLVTEIQMLTFSTRNIPIYIGRVFPTIYKAPLESSESQNWVAVLSFNAQISLKQDNNVRKKQSCLNPVLGIFKSIGRSASRVTIQATFVVLRLRMTQQWNIDGGPPLYSCYRPEL